MRKKAEQESDNWKQNVLYWKYDDILNSEDGKWKAN